MTIAIAAGDPTVRDTMRAALTGASYTLMEPDTIDTQDAVSGAYAVCIEISGEASLTTLAALRSADPDLPVVCVGSEALSRQALEAGAYDYVRQPVDASVLVRVVAHAVEKRQLTNQVQELRSGLGAGKEDSDTVVPLRELERQAIARALRATKGSVTKAAKLLGIGRATLYRRLASPDMANLRPRRGFDGAQRPPLAVGHPPLAVVTESR